MDNNESKGLKTPIWDGKVETCPRYLDQIEALAKYYYFGDALDEVKMLADGPTKSEFDALSSTSKDPAELAKIKLYKANKRLCVIITLGQKMDHGLSVLKKIKTDDFPQQITYRILQILKQKKGCDGQNRIEEGAGEGQIFICKRLLQRCHCCDCSI